MILGDGGGGNLILGRKLLSFIFLLSANCCNVDVLYRYRRLSS